MTRYTLRTVILLIALFSLLSACASGSVKKALEGQRPTAELAASRIVHLSFESVALAFDIRVKNPNPVGISLSGIDYEVKLAGASFTKGSQTEGVRIAASGSSTITLPLELSFEELAKSYQGIKGKSSVDYSVEVGLFLDVPVLGRLRYPLVISGTLPVPKRPSVKLSAIKMERLDLSGARLAVAIEVENPNDFSLTMKRLDYALKVNGKSWASGVSEGATTIGEKGKGVITLPVTLDLRQLGSGLYDTLHGGGAVNYALSGRLDAGSGNALLEEFTLPFDKSGTLAVSR